MSAFSKAELVGVLHLPMLPLESRRAGVVVPSTEDLAGLLRRKISEVRASAEAGNPVDQAISTLLPKNHAKIWTAIIKTIASRPLRSVQDKGRHGTRPRFDIESLAPLLYERAIEAVAADRIEEAVVALALVARSETGRADGLLGLAVCAAKIQDYETARVLALETLKHRPGHPRACCIAGRCELERGDKKAAQHHLALAARMGRRQPEFRDDLRAAQRLLLMMHMA
jgi:hypothetical protein